MYRKTKNSPADLGDSLMENSKLYLLTLNLIFSPDRLKKVERLIRGEISKVETVVKLSDEGNRSRRIFLAGKAVTLLLSE